MNSKKLLQPDLFTRRFWLFVSLLALVLIATQSRNITRPFQGLHSWSEASIAWRSKCYLKYHVSYTKMLSTWAVGDPPSPEKAQHYLDHPQLGMLLRTVDMIIFGVNEQAQRIGSILRNLFCLYFFIKILQNLTTKKIAFLASAIFIMFPLTQYFPIRDWCFPLSFLLTWLYLITIGSIKEHPQPKRRHFIGLALSLFFIVQMSWSGFFYAMAIGIHYVFKHIKLRRWPSNSVLAILIIAPFSSLILNFVIMAAGHGWDFTAILKLYQWRAGSGELEKHIWSDWFQILWEHGVHNFTAAILYGIIIYFTFGQLIIFMQSDSAGSIRRDLQFPQFWLFLMPGIFQLFLLKGTLRAHQYWERPLAPFVAIAGAMLIVLVYDTIKKLNKEAGIFACCVILGLFSFYCVKGSNYYYGVRWQQTKKIDMFKNLNKRISSDKGLLSFEDFIVYQNEIKGAFYRPEIAWYLDRKIVPAHTIDQIKAAAATGDYPFYLMPTAYLNQQVTSYLQRLGQQLVQLYPYEVVEGISGQRGTMTIPVKVGMPTYLIFDLAKKPHPVSVLQNKTP